MPFSTKSEVAVKLEQEMKMLIFAGSLHAFKCFKKLKRGDFDYLDSQTFTSKSLVCVCVYVCTCQFHSIHSFRQPSTPFLITDH